MTLLHPRPTRPCHGGGRRRQRVSPLPVVCGPGTPNIVGRDDRRDGRAESHGFPGEPNP